MKKKNKSSSDSKDTRNAIIAVVVILGLVAIAIVALNYTKFSPAKEDDVLAVVNGDNIYKSDVAKRVSYLKAQMGDMATTSLALNLSINELLLLQEARKAGIAVDEAAIDKAVEDWLTGVKSSLSDEELKTLLGKENLTLEQYLIDIKEAYRKQMLIYGILNQSVLAKLEPVPEQEIEIDEEDISDYYNDNKDDLVQIKLSHILVCYEDAPGCESNRTKEDAKKFADSLYQMLLQGQNFGDLATLYSDDSGSKSQGGQLDWSQKGSYIPEFEDAAFDLKVINQYTQPVETTYGFHIIKLDGKKETFDDLKEGIKFQLAMERQLEISNEKQMVEQQAILEYIEQLWNESEIKIIDDGSGLSKLVPSTSTTDPGIKTFSEVDGEACMQDGKPVIRLFSTTSCPHCRWIASTFDETAKQLVSEGKAVAFHWELDTGDNTLTSEKESEVPQSERDIYKRFNPQGSIPTFVFGCKYYRIGTGYERENRLDLEKAEFNAVVSKLSA